MEVALSNVGIHKAEPSPTLQVFAPRFIQEIETVCADRPSTVSFYKLKLKPLLASKLADLRLDAIEENEIEEYTETRSATQSRRKKPLSPGSVNRELATLRRMLRVAYRWKIINRVPVISLLRGEKHCETILTLAQEPMYLDLAPDPLQRVATALLDTGLRMRELLTLDWENVHLDPRPPLNTAI